MSDKWPTLEGRLNQPLTSTGEALEQMVRNGDVLSELGQKTLEKYRQGLKSNRQTCSGNSTGRVSPL